MHRNALEEMKVQDVQHLVVKDPSVIGPEATMEELLEKVVEDTRTRHVYVVDNEGLLIGAVRLQSVVQYLFPAETVEDDTSHPLVGRMLELTAAKTVRAIMNDTPRFVSPTTNLADMAGILMAERITELPVVDRHGKLVGQVNMYEVIEGYMAARTEEPPVS